MREDFLKEIIFDKVFSHIEYVDDNEKVRRVQRMEKIQQTKGYIIGSCYKYDGYYTPTVSSKDYWGEIDYQQGSIDNRKSIKYWVVVVDMNKTYLVPKKEVEKWRFERNNIIEDKGTSLFE